jgi:hypothetical protein
MAQSVALESLPEQKLHRLPKEPSFGEHVALAFRLRRFARRYFAQLQVEYRSLCPEPYQLANVAEFAELESLNTSAPSWIANHRLEYLLVAGLPEEILRQRGRVHRSRLLALVGEDTADTEATFPAPSDDWPLEKARAQALGTLLEVQRLRHVQSEFSRLRNRLLLVSLAPGIAFVSLAMWFAVDFAKQPLVASVTIFGLLGGYLSVLMRLGVLRWDRKYAENYQQVDRVFWNVALNLFLSGLQGALGAIILYFLFSADIFRASIFPSFVETLDKARQAAAQAQADGSLDARSLSFVPRGVDLSHQQFAQLMLWSTVAGFTERLVPDILGSLSKEPFGKKAKAGA